MKEQAIKEVDKLELCRGNCKPNSGHRKYIR